jgi:hypothetical protein
MLHCDLAHVASMAMSGTQMQNDRADIEPLTAHMLHCILRFRALNRRLVNDHEGRGRARNLQ